MLCSTVTIQNFLDELIADMGLYEGCERALYRQKMNETLQFLYAVIIRSEAEGTATPQDGLIPRSAIPTASNVAGVQLNDVLAVYDDSRQLRYLPPADLPAAAGLPGFYTVTQEGIRLSDASITYPLRVRFTERPHPYGADSENAYVPLPNEFLPMLAARIRGEVYRLVNEDAPAAKWLALYNAYLEDFFTYLADRRKEG